MVFPFPSHHCISTGSTSLLPRGRESPRVTVRWRSRKREQTRYLIYFSSWGHWKFLRGKGFKALSPSSALVEVSFAAQATKQQGRCQGTFLGLILNSYVARGCRFCPLPPPLRIAPSTLIPRGRQCLSVVCQLYPFHPIPIHTNAD